MRLADDFVERRRAQPFGERGAAGQVLDTRFVKEVHSVSISSVPSNPSTTLPDNSTINIGFVTLVVTTGRR
jgi:hypothetical protein